MRVDTTNALQERVTYVAVTSTMLFLALSGWAAYLGLDMNALAYEALKTVGVFLLGGVVATPTALRGAHQS